MFSKAKFYEYEDFFASPHSESFELLTGEGAVIISAPHSVEQIRNGHIKYAEPQTGVLAKMLHDSLNCPVIYKTRNCDDDANYDEHSPYKQALCDYVKNNSIAFLIDLHQLAPSRDVKINLGTGKMKNISNPEYINAAIQAFSSRDIGPIQIDTPFNASYPFTVSSFVADNCGISCLQIELHSNIVQIDAKDSTAEKVFDALVDIINNISKILQGEEK